MIFKLLSTALALHISLVVYSTDLCGQTTKIYSNIFEQETTPHLVLGDLESVVKYFLDNSKNLSIHDRGYLTKKLKEVRKTADEMPGTKFTVKVIDALADEIAGEHCLDYRAVFHMLEKRLEEHLSLKSKNKIGNLAEQWEFVFSFFEDLKTNTRCHEEVRATFCWKVIGARRLTLLLQQKRFAVQTGISEKDLLKLANTAKKTGSVYKAKVSVHSKKTIRKILDLLSKKQQQKLAFRTGISPEKAHELYADCKIVALTRILDATPRKIELCKLHSVNHRKPRHPKLPLKTIKRWTSFYENKALQAEMSRMSILHHVVQFNKPELEITEDLRQIFSTPDYTVQIVSTEGMIVSSEIHRWLSAKPEHRDYYLKTLQPESNAWRVHYFERANLELTAEQYRKLVVLSYEATNRLLDAKTEQEVIEANNKWIAGLGEFLLPKQAALVFHQTLASQGLVFYLTRPDVMKTMDISESQKKKIVSVAKECADTARKFDQQLRDSCIDEIINKLTPLQRKKLFQLLDVTPKEFREVVAAKRNFFQIFQPVPNWSYQYRPRKPYPEFGRTRPTALEEARKVLKIKQPK